jgi:hypothetical protein
MCNKLQQCNDELNEPKEKPMELSNQLILACALVALGIPIILKEEPKC